MDDQTSPVRQLARRMFSIEGVSSLTKASVIKPHPTNDILVMYGQSSITASKGKERDCTNFRLFYTHRRQNYKNQSIPRPEGEVSFSSLNETLFIVRRYWNRIIYLNMYKLIV